MEIEIVMHDSEGTTIQYIVSSNCNFNFNKEIEIYCQSVQHHVLDQMHTLEEVCAHMHTHVEKTVCIPDYHRLIISTRGLHIQDTLNKSDELVLSFHTKEDIEAWVSAHPNPYSYLTEVLSVGGTYLHDGKLVAFPTETVYGLGTDATNVDAVRSIFVAKERPSHDPLIVHISDKKDLYPLVREVPPKAERLIDIFWPGPLTIILHKSDVIDDIVTSGHSSVAIRMPEHPVARALISLSGKPIAAPSANRFGCTSPTTAQHVQDQLEGRYDLLIDGGSCTIGIESTVISFLKEPPVILRPGGISKEEIESCIGVVQTTTSYQSTESSFESPGLLSSHYAPRTPLYIVDDISLYIHRKDVGFLLFGKSPYTIEGPVSYLSLSHDIQEAARHLYKEIRYLDSLQLSFLLVTLVPEVGIGVGINNRIRKAATHTQVPKGGS